MTHSPFDEFAILLSLTAFLGFIALKLRQPLLLAFIVTGMIAGPFGLNFITAQSHIDFLASLGVTMLLFIVGLKLDIDAIKAFGTVVLAIGIGQMALTMLLGFFIAYALGISAVPALFTALALAFSSTIIIIKSLSDHDELDSLSGRIAVGILLVQDLVVVIAIILLSSMDIVAGATNHVIFDFILLISKGAAFLAVTGMLMRTVLPAAMEQVAHSRELLVLFALSWAVLLAMTAEMLGFGIEIGGFLAGVSLASTQYRESVASRLDTVRNLLLVFFFINLGASVQFNTLTNAFFPVIVLSIFVLLFKPAIVIGLMGAARFRQRTAFMTGATMGQVSEFSLILASLAHNLGYINNDTVGLIIFISLITIGLSTYMLNYDSLIYSWFAPALNSFERKSHYREDVAARADDKKIQVIIYGFGRHGECLANALKEKGIKTLGVDFDPRKVKPHHHHAMPIRYGDAEDVEFLKTLPLDHAKWVVSTIPHADTNQMLVAALHEMKFKGKVALSAYHDSDVELAKKLRVDLIFVSYQDAALSAAEQLAAAC